MRPDYQVTCNFANIDRMMGLEVGTSYTSFCKGTNIGGGSRPSEMDIDYPISFNETASFSDFTSRVKELLSMSDLASQVGDSLTVKVDVKGNIVVDGLGGGEITAQVEGILNADEQLGRALFKSALANDFAADLKTGGSEKSGAIEKALVESYLRDQLGYDIDCEEAVYLAEGARGGDETLKEFLRNDPLLYQQMLNISLASGATKSEPYTTAWTFQLN